MITVRKAQDRGHANHGWLDSHHTFSFASYHDPAHMGFRHLRVINEDKVSGGQGFGAHPHRDMEIISYVVSGELAHKDSMGNASSIKAGEFQIITAGTGITHSEYNGSADSSVHFYQIWLMPHTKGLTPSYSEATSLPREEGLKLIASPNGEIHTLRINQDVKLYRGIVKQGKSVKLPIEDYRYGWLQIVAGNLLLEDKIGNNHIELAISDGAALAEVSSPLIRAESECEFIFFDLA